MKNAIDETDANSVTSTNDRDADILTGDKKVTFTIEENTEWNCLYFFGLLMCFGKFVPIPNPKIWIINVNRLSHDRCFVRIREVDDTEELKIQLMSDDKREYILSSNQKIISLRLSRLLSSSWTLFMLFRFENDFCEEKKN